MGQKLPADAGAVNRGRAPARLRPAWRENPPACMLARGEMGMRRLRNVAAVTGLIWLAACAGSEPVQVAMPAPELPAPQGFLQCVPYARDVSGIEIYGDAWSWWQAAAGRYDRGAAPRPGAVLVMKRDGRLPNGHVAVVTTVISAREIRVTHANWGNAGKPRGQVERDIPVIDVSPRNDWTEVRVWNGASFGRIYPAHGFIYRAAPGQSI